MTMPENKLKIGGAIIAVLVVVNIVLHLIWNWGLVTVKVTDAPIGKVIKSIQSQAHVTIYSNIDPQTKVSMYVDHVPLPEAMASLAVNADAQWHLGFFVGPTSAQVKNEIRTFTEGAERDDDSIRIYNFPTPLEMFTSEANSTPDPRRQVWPGLTTPPPAPPPAADSDLPAPESYVAPTTVQGYLRAFASEADVWIMAPAAWDSAVASAPPASPSISGAIRHFVGSAHGSVTQAIILRGRPQRVAGEGRRGRGEFRGAGMDMGMMENRMENAINGLPPAERPAVHQQLQQEAQFQKEVRQAPPERRRQMWRQHMMEHRLANGNNWRRSPEKRAQMYARMVSNRMAAQGK